MFSGWFLFGIIIVLVVKVIFEIVVWFFIVGGLCVGYSFIRFCSFSGFICFLYGCRLGGAELVVSFVGLGLRLFVSFRCLFV